MAWIKKFLVQVRPRRINLKEDMVKHKFDFYFRYVEKHPKTVIAVILLITGIMAIQICDIGLNASYSAFVPWSESIDRFEGGIDGQKPVTGVEKNRFASFFETLDVTYSETDEVSDENIVDYGSDSKSNSTVKVEDNVNADLPYTSTYLLMVGGEDIYTDENLTLLSSCLKSFSSFRDVGEPYSVFDYFTFEKNGTRLRITPISPNDDGIWSEDEVRQLEKRITSDPMLQYFLVGDDYHHFLFSIPISNVSSDRLDEFYDFFQPLREAGLDVYINGGPVITAKIMEYLIRDLSRLLVLCFVAIVIIYYFTFRSKRSVLIPATLSIIGLVWTLGTMSMLGIDISILNVVTPCMVLTLGSAYSIYLLSDYYASFSSKEEISTPVQVTRRTMRTIFFACFTTVVGFLCLLISRTSGLREFGLSVALGLSFCAILSFTYLPAVLMIVQKPNSKQIERYEHGLMARFIHTISYIITKYWYVLCLVFALLCCVHFYIRDKIPLDSNYMSYFPESDPFGQESRAFAETMGGSNPFTIEIIAPDGSNKFFLNKDNLIKVRQYEEAILECPDILQSISFTNYISFTNEVVGNNYEIPESNGLINMLSRLVLMLGNYNPQIGQIVSDDFNSISLVIQHWDSQEKDLMTTSSIGRAYQMMVDNLNLLPAGTTVLIKGDPIANFKFSNRLMDDQNLSTLLSITIVFLTMTLLFKSIKKGVLTIVPVISGIMINYIFMYITGIPFDMVTVSFSSIAIGCGVDDAIHFTFKLQSELQKEKSVEEAVHDTINLTGRSIIMTTVSIVVGMMMLSFASYTPIRYFGLLMSVTLFGCMASTLIFLPSFTLLFDKIGKAIGKTKKTSEKYR